MLFGTSLKSSFVDSLIRKKTFKHFYSIKTVHIDDRMFLLRYDSDKRLQIFQDSARIEAAFRKYMHRADVDQSEDSYEIIVCHANVIRYFVCRWVISSCTSQHLWFHSAFVSCYIVIVIRTVNN